MMQTVNPTPTNLCPHPNSGQKSNVWMPSANNRDPALNSPVTQGRASPSSSPAPLTAVPSASAWRGPCVPDGVELQVQLQGAQPGSVAEGGEGPRAGAKGERRTARGSDGQAAAATPTATAGPQTRGTEDGGRRMKDAVRGSWMSPRMWGRATTRTGAHQERKRESAPAAIQTEAKVHPTGRGTPLGAFAHFIDDPLHGFTLRPGGGISHFVFHISPGSKFAHQLF